MQLSIGATYRIAEVLRVLRKYKIFKLMRSSCDDRTFAIALRQAFEELGSFTIKCGQYLSVCYAQIPYVYRKEFSKLQQSVTPVPFEQIEPIINKYAGTYVRKHIKHIDKQPIATASIAQVHKAYLTDGTPVAIKVAKPGSKDIIQRDLWVLSVLKRLFLRRHCKKHNFDIDRFIDDVSTFLLAELDFQNEAKNIALFKEVIIDRYECVPEVHFVSSDVLIEEFFEGYHLQDVKGLKKAGHTPQSISDQIGHVVTYHIFQDGMYHGDPHAGNIIVRPDGRLGYVDLGVLTIIPYSQRVTYIQEFIAFLENRPIDFLWIHLTMNNYTVSQDVFDDVSEQVERIFSRKHKEDTYTLFIEINDLFFEKGIPDNKKFFLIVRSMLAFNTIAKHHNIVVHLDNFIYMIFAAQSIPTVQSDFESIERQSKLISPVVYSALAPLRMMLYKETIGKSLIFSMQKQGMIQTMDTIKQQNVHAMKSFVALGLILLVILGIIIGHRELAVIFSDFHLIVPILLINFILMLAFGIHRILRSF